jgi:hypothetical protein
MVVPFIGHDQLFYPNQGPQYGENQKTNKVPNWRGQTGFFRIKYLQRASDPAVGCDSAECSGMCHKAGKKKALASLGLLAAA